MDGTNFTLPTFIIMKLYEHEVIVLHVFSE